MYFTKQSTATDCGGNIKNRVVRITLNDDNSVTADPEAAGCFPVYQPAPGYYVTIHNGGNLHFGPDGKLYIGVGNSNEEITDPNRSGARSGVALGKIHRYNPTMPLSVPADNPFVTWPNADKSNYAYGLRNPFDFTFDPVSRQLFATDNGDECDDEINLIRPGYNYGWRLNYPQTPLPCDDDVGPDPRYNTIPPLYPLDAVDGADRHHVLYRRSDSRMEERSLHVRLQGQFHCAASFQIERGAHGHRLAHDSQRYRHASEDHNAAPMC